MGGLAGCRGDANCSIPLQSSSAACLPLDSISGSWVAVLQRAGQPRRISVITPATQQMWLRGSGSDLGTLPIIWAEISEGMIKYVFYATF